MSSAPELARLTLNLAKAHTDPGASAHGRRLVYGGHTIAVAAAQATRAIPNLVTIVAWHGCDHLAPVFEGDVLATELSVEGAQPLDGAAEAWSTCGLGCRPTAPGAARSPRFSTGASWD